jgi:integrase
VLPPSVVESIRSTLIAAGRGSDATLVSVMAYAGLRPGEALALRWRHVGDRTLRIEAAVALGQEKGTKAGAVRT